MASGATSGAVIGASIAAAPATGGLSLLIPATMGGVGLANYYSPANRAERKFLRADIKAMKAGKLGYTEEQKRQMQQMALQNIRQQSSAAQAAAQQQAAQGGMMGRAGQQYAAQLGISNAAAQQAGAVAGQAQAQSDVQVERRRAEILARISTKAAQNRKQAKQAQDTIAQAGSAALMGYGQMQNDPQLYQSGLSILKSYQPEREE